MTGQTAATSFDTAYLALQHAASRVGAAEHQHQYRAHLRKGRSPRTYRYCPTVGHVELIEAMGGLGRGVLTIEEAMAALHYGESAEALRKARVTS